MSDTDTNLESAPARPKPAKESPVLAEVGTTATTNTTTQVADEKHAAKPQVETAADKARKVQHELLKLISQANNRDDMAEVFKGLSVDNENSREFLATILNKTDIIDFDYTLGDQTLISFLMSGEKNHLLEIIYTDFIHKVEPKENDLPHVTIVAKYLAEKELLSFNIIDTYLHHLSDYSINAQAKQQHAINFISGMMHTIGSPARLKAFVNHLKNERENIPYFATTYTSYVPLSFLFDSNTSGWNQVMKIAEERMQELAKSTKTESLECDCGTKHYFK